MKKLVVFLSILSISAGLWAELNTDEIIFYEEFSPLKDEKKIEQFSNYYQSLVDKNEPETLGWKFFKAEDKVIAILRWKNSDAIVKHLENVSEGGILEEDFQAFNEHFAINSISVYGNVDQEVKAMLMDFGLPFEFNPLIAGYSR
tara:strand:- start:810 stop:1244 length:435 start_codon:yes stop_codon:yes gene_type:complete